MINPDANTKIISLEIYTDGSCKKIGAQSFGAWGFCIVEDGQVIYKKYGGAYDTTNQRMELTAIAEALKASDNFKKKNQNVIILSDSAYSCNAINQNWTWKWRNNGFQTSTGTDVKNQDLWWELIPYFDKFGYSIKKVEAHKDNYFNNLVDEMVQAEADRLKKNWGHKEDN